MFAHRDDNGRTTEHELEASSMQLDNSQRGELIIPEPLLFFSQVDEDLFFHGLKSIPAIGEFSIRPGAPMSGLPNQITLTLQSSKMDDDSLRNLIGLLMRYGLEMKSLNGQVSELNQHWFMREDQYWFAKVFGDST